MESIEKKALVIIAIVIVSSIQYVSTTISYNQCKMLLEKINILNMNLATSSKLCKQMNKRINDYKEIIAEPAEYINIEEYLNIVQMGNKLKQKLLDDYNECESLLDIGRNLYDTKMKKVCETDPVVLEDKIPIVSEELEMENLTTEESSTNTDLNQKIDEVVSEMKKVCETDPVVLEDKIPVVSEELEMENLTTEEPSTNTDLNQKIDEVVSDYIENSGRPNKSYDEIMKNRAVYDTIVQSRNNLLDKIKVKISVYNTIVRSVGNLCNILMGKNLENTSYARLTEIEESEASTSTGRQ